MIGKVLSQSPGGQAEPCRRITDQRHERMFAILIDGDGGRRVEKGVLGIVTVGGVERRIDLSNPDLDRAAAVMAARCVGWRG
ncbi:hypothetical protein ABZ342_16930 [Amycolatopsis sp. NPDC005961]|uniref:hypothetical protein n=1 Tax=Amycolatopsis sp. NPDC005961 TaxID=3156720 RepID=UPI00340FEED1